MRHNLFFWGKIVCSYLFILRTISAYSNRRVGKKAAYRVLRVNKTFYFILIIGASVKWDNEGIFCLKKMLKMLIENYNILLNIKTTVTKLNMAPKIIFIFNLFNIKHFVLCINLVYIIIFILLNYNLIILLFFNI